MGGISGLVEQLIMQALLDYEDGDENAFLFLVEAGILEPDGFNIDAINRIKQPSAHYPALH